MSFNELLDKALDNTGLKEYVIRDFINSITEAVGEISSVPDATQDHFDATQDHFDQEYEEEIPRKTQEAQVLNIKYPIYGTS